MEDKFSRRQFLKVSSLAIGAGLFHPAVLGVLPPNKNFHFPVTIGRVAVPAIYIYKEPSFDSERAGTKSLDELLTILEEIESPYGPAYNPVWYRVYSGYAHSGRIQRVDVQPPNGVLQSIPEKGCFGEITVPFTRSFRLTRSSRWQPLYRLYYRSVHHITGIDEGPDGEPWYRLKDDAIGVVYHVTATDVRPIPYEEYSPLARDVPWEEKRIEISIADQSLAAFEGKQQVFNAKVASGIHSKTVDEGELPTDTPTGNFHIQLKTPSRHMGDGNLTQDIYAYELPGVPWTMVFHKSGVALHGTYWHNNFGVRMSHGCVNLRNEDAKWLFRWTDPVFDRTDWYAMGYGTLVQVR
jgi:hypothetical protein